MQAYYQQLRARGKVGKVALIACMRKLLTIVNAKRPGRTPGRSCNASLTSPATRQLLNYAGPRSCFGLSELLGPRTASLTCQTY